MSRSGWWLAFSARKATATTKAMAAPKPSKRNSFTISSPLRVHPGRRPSPSSTFSSLSLATSHSSRVGLGVQDLVQLQDLTRRYHADEAAAGVDDREAVDVGRLHGRHRLPERPRRLRRRQIVAHDALDRHGLPLVLLGLRQ